MPTRERYRSAGLESRYDDYLLDLDAAAEWCLENGYSATGPHFEMMRYGIRKEYPDLFGEEIYTDSVYLEFVWIDAAKNSCYNDAAEVMIYE